jgi:hypothetical protein
MKSKMSKKIRIGTYNTNNLFDRFVVLGDMNDTPDSTPLEKFLRTDNPLKLHNVIADIPQDGDAPNSSIRFGRGNTWSRARKKGKFAEIVLKFRVPRMKQFSAHCSSAIF